MSAYPNKEKRTRERIGSARVQRQLYYLGAATGGQGVPDAEVPADVPDDDPVAPLPVDGDELPELAPVELEPGVEFVAELFDAEFDDPALGVVLPLVPGRVPHGPPLELAPGVVFGFMVDG